MRDEMKNLFLAAHELEKITHNVLVTLTYHGKKRHYTRCFPVGEHAVAEIDEDNDELKTITISFPAA